MDDRAAERWKNYQQMIVTSATYSGMPDLINTDGSIQWEAPSNRKGTGPHVHTHQRRREWWERKAESLGIDTSSPQWISRTAKAIHPTKIKTCKKCGREMDIRYVYPSARLVQKLQKYDFLADLLEDPFVTIYDICARIYENTSNPSEVVQGLLKTSAFKEIPKFLSFDSLEAWLQATYVPSEPKVLSPGAMSNAPDRLDGFHSFNRCCRHSADKGRSKENLAAYTTDRRAFEHWTDGNWVAANKLMGLLQQRPSLRKTPCANSDLSVSHSGPATADHIGPISLGFSHRPTFRILCQRCNSAKNARMTDEDYLHLINDELNGEQICSWYLRPLWELGKGEVLHRLPIASYNRMLRDNRDFAFELLCFLMLNDCYLTLTTLLSFEYALGKWVLDEDSISIEESVITASFLCLDSDVKYRHTQLNRYLRVSFEALNQYRTKASRNTASRVAFLSTPDMANILKAAKSLEERYAGLSAELQASIRANKEVSLTVFQELISIGATVEAATVRVLLEEYMEEVAEIIWQNRSDDRYTRMI